MSTTAKGFLVILVVGLIVLAVAAWADRRTRLRGEGQLPSRQTDADAHDAGRPPADGGTERPPDYRTATELLRHSPALAPFGAGEQTALRGAEAVALTLANPGLATHDGPRSLAPDTRVLVCDEPVETVRELLPLWQLLPAGQAVTIAAPAIDPAVIDTLLANNRAGTRLTQAVTGEAAARSQLAELTGASPLPRASLQAGDVPATALGQAALIAADARGTLVCVTK